jgi:hypothetical protein
VIDHHYLHPEDQTMAINNLRDFAMQEAPETTTVVPGEGGYSKDGKQIITPNPTEVHSLDRWGMWGGFDYFGDGHNLYQGSFGIDYRVAPHWIVGADMRLGYVNGHSGLSVAQGGLYTAFYQNHWWGVAGTLLGPNEYTLYGGAGYDFRAGDFIFGPVVVGQFDDVTVDEGFGRGNVEQVRVGGRVAYIRGRVQPWCQLMFQRQFSTSDNNDPIRQNGVWAGAGANFIVSPKWTIYAGWDIEANGDFQINQGTIGARYQF